MTPKCVMLLGVICVAMLLARAATAQTTQPAHASARGAGEFRPIMRSQAESDSPDSGREKTSVAFDASKVAVSLGAVLVLILVLKWSAKRMFPGQIGVRSSRAIEVLSRSPLSPRQQFLLLRVGKRLVVVADSGGSMSPICQITDADEVAEMLGQVDSRPADTLGRSFMTLFGRNREKFEEKASVSVSTEMEDASADAEETPEVGMTRDEIGGLMEKVRLLSKQFKR